MNIPESKYPLVTIITVNFNQPKITIDLIESLKNSSYPNSETIVIDNGSDNEILKNAIKSYPSVKYFDTGKNLGFAGGNNYGLKHANGKYVLFINNDTEVEPDFLEPLIERLENEPKFGLLSPKIKFFDYPDKIQYAGYTDLNFVTLRNKIIGYNALDRGQFDKPNETYFAHGAAMIAPMKVIKQVGMMSECFFLYYEEMDWGKRIRNAGYKIGYEPKSVIYHKESVTTGKNSPLKTYYYARNRLIYLRRNFTGLKLIAGFSYNILLALPKNLISHLIKGEFKQFRSYLYGFLWSLKEFRNPELFKNTKLN